ncbi:unnamed protein product [Colias eurytheme]|nr:unnamed protein product [Colias eurytheme]
MKHYYGFHRPFGRQRIPHLSSSMPKPRSHRQCLGLGPYCLWYLLSILYGKTFIDHKRLSNTRCARMTHIKDARRPVFQCVGCAPETPPGDLPTTLR